MKKTRTILVCLGAIYLSQVARADFKYAETSRVTGGMMAGMLKFAGHFSKNANAPMVSTVYVKGNRLRRESADRSAEIIDLDGRRVIAIDNQKHTYSVATFDEIRQGMQQLQKNSSQMQGLPLLQNVSMYMGGMPQGQAGTASGAQPQGGSQSGSQGSSASHNSPASASEAAVKALSTLGGFGGFGRRK